MSEVLPRDAPEVVALIDYAASVRFEERSEDETQLLLDNGFVQLQAPCTADGVRGLRDQVKDWDVGGPAGRVPQVFFL